MPGDRDRRRRKPGKKRNGDLNAAALFPFAAQTPAGKRNRKRCSGPLLRRGAAEKSKEKSKEKSGAKAARKDDIIKEFRK